MMSDVRQDAWLLSLSSRIDRRTSHPKEDARQAESDEPLADTFDEWVIEFDDEFGQ